MRRSTFKVEGFKELDAGLGELKQATALNVLRRVASGALEPIREKAEALAPELSGKLAKAETVSTKRPKGRRPARRESTVEAFMGPDANEPFAVKKGVQNEFGNINHGPQPFMRPAWDGGKDQALEDVKDGLGEEIEKARVRALKKTARLLKKSGG